MQTFFNSTTAAGESSRYYQTSTGYFAHCNPAHYSSLFHFIITWFGGKGIGLPSQVLAPGALIGTNNFIELAVAVAIALFGLQSGMALVTEVGC